MFQLVPSPRQARQAIDRRNITVLAQNKYNSAMQRMVMDVVMMIQQDQIDTQDTGNTQYVSLMSPPKQASAEITRS